MKFKAFSVLSLAIAGAAVSSAQMWINEVQPNTSGTDPVTQMFEFKGTANASISGYLLSIESDVTSGTGLVDRFYEVSGTFDANGIFVMEGDDLENPSFTLVFVDNFTGDNNTDFDSDNDGVMDLDLETVGITSVFDAIGVTDGEGEPLYGAQLGGSDFSFIAAGNSNEAFNIFRDGSSNAWYAHMDVALEADTLFDIDGNIVNTGTFNADPFTPTFGAVNPQAVPEPATMIALGLGAAALIRRKRK